MSQAGPSLEQPCYADQRVADQRLSAARGRYGALATAVIAAAVALVLWRAWVCDDAYITFRIVHHTQLGYGPVFNIGERVQAFTHPLWFLVLLISSYACHDFHVLSVSLGLILTAGAFLLLGIALRPSAVSTLPGDGATSRQGWPLSKDELLLLAAACILLASPSFIEFQTSGLENALTHLLLFAFFACLMQVGARLPGVTLPMLLAGLVIMNRPDQVLLLAPALAWITWKGVRADRANVLRILAAMSPMLVWFAFATLYYGSPIPNTAYAKICDLGVRMGLRYAAEYLYREPISALTVLAAGIAAPLRMLTRQRGTIRSSGAWLTISAGIWLQVGYVIWLGGDFMRGRFFLTSLIAAMFVLIALGRDVLIERSYGRSVQMFAVVALPAAAIVRVAEYIAVGPLTGFVSVVAQERSTRIVFILAVLIWIMAMVWTVRRIVRKQDARSLAFITLLHTAFLLGMAGYREMHWTVGLAYCLFAAASILLLRQCLAQHAGSFTLTNLTLLGVVLMPHLEFDSRTIGTSLSIPPTGIVHEYDHYAGAWNANRFQPASSAAQPAIAAWAEKGMRLRAYSDRFGPITVRSYNLGHCGWEAGPRVHLIDPYGLADAFVARCPYAPAWRPGHIVHLIPVEYEESLGVLNLLPDWENRVARLDPTLRQEAIAMAQSAASRTWRDDRLQRLHQVVQRVVGDPIFSKHRLRDLPAFALNHSP